MICQLSTGSATALVGWGAVSIALSGAAAGDAVTATEERTIRATEFGVAAPEGLVYSARNESLLCIALTTSLLLIGLLALRFVNFAYTQRRIFRHLRG